MGQIAPLVNRRRAVSGARGAGGDPGPSRFGLQKPASSAAETVRHPVDPTVPIRLTQTPTAYRDAGATLTRRRPPGAPCRQISDATSGPDAQHPSPVVERRKSTYCGRKRLRVWTRQFGGEAGLQRRRRSPRVRSERAFPWDTTRASGRAGSDGCVLCSATGYGTLRVGGAFASR